MITESDALDFANSAPQFIAVNYGSGERISGSTNKISEELNDLVGGTFKASAQEIDALLDELLNGNGVAGVSIVGIDDDSVGLAFTNGGGTTDTIVIDEVPTESFSGRVDFANRFHQYGFFEYGSDDRISGSTRAVSGELNDLVGGTFKATEKEIDAVLSEVLSGGGVDGVELIGLTEDGATLTFRNGSVLDTVTFDDIDPAKYSGNLDFANNKAQFKFVQVEDGERVSGSTKKISQELSDLVGGTFKADEVHVVLQELLTGDGIDGVELIGLDDDTAVIGFTNGGGTTDIVLFDEVEGLSGPDEPEEPEPVPVAFFAADTPGTGRELFAFDGEKVVLAADIQNGANDSRPADLTVLGDEVFFTAERDDVGLELFRYGPVTGTASLAAEIQEGAANSFPAFLAVLGDELFFSANGEDVGGELFRYDPATGTASLAADIRDGSASSFPSQLTVLGDELFFGAQRDDVGVELFRYDPVTGTASLAADINEGTGGSFVSDLTVLGDELYFSAFDGTGFPVFRYDPVLDEVSQISDGGGDLTALGDQLYFQASSGEAGNELFRYDPDTGQVSLVADIQVGSDGSSPSDLIAVAGDLYFKAERDDVGQELFRYDPDSGETNLIADIRPGDSGSRIIMLGDFEGTLLFAADADADRDARELYTFDGTTLTEITDVPDDFEPVGSGIAVLELPADTADTLFA